jgi:hypothetical protein
MTKRDLAKIFQIYFRLPFGYFPDPSRPGTGWIENVEDSPLLLLLFAFSSLATPPAMENEQEKTQKVKTQKAGLSRLRTSGRAGSYGLVRASCKSKRSEDPYGRRGGARRRVRGAIYGSWPWALWQSCGGEGTNPQAGYLHRSQREGRPYGRATNARNRACIHLAERCHGRPPLRQHADSSSGRSAGRVLPALPARASSGVPWPPSARRHDMHADVDLVVACGHVPAVGETWPRGARK